MSNNLDRALKLAQKTDDSLMVGRFPEAASDLHKLQNVLRTMAHGEVAGVHPAPTKSEYEFGWLDHDQGIHFCKICDRDYREHSQGPKAMCP